MSTIIKNTDKEKLVHWGHGIVFDGKGSWFFGNDFARNVVVFGVNNSLSSHPNKCKNKFFC